jgi:hypothetical protein
MTPGYRVAWFATALALCVLLAGVPARATLDAVIAQQILIPDKQISDCVARASGALTIVLQDAHETDPGSGQWVGVGRSSGSIAALAVIECHPVDTGGYSASFTCSVQAPTYSDTASGLCAKLSAAFNTTPATQSTQGGAL